MEEIYLVCKKAKLVRQAKFAREEDKFELELDGKIPLATLKAVIKAVEETVSKTGDQHLTNDVKKSLD